MVFFLVESGISLNDDHERYVKSLDIFVGFLAWNFFIWNYHFIASF